MGRRPGCRVGTGGAGAARGARSEGRRERAWQTTDGGRCSTAHIWEASASAPAPGFVCAPLLPPPPAPTYLPRPLQRTAHHAPRTAPRHASRTMALPRCRRACLRARRCPPACARPPLLAGRRRCACCRASRRWCWRTRTRGTRAWRRSPRGRPRAPPSRTSTSRTPRCGRPPCTRCTPCTPSLRSTTAAPGTWLALLQGFSLRPTPLWPLRRSPPASARASAPPNPSRHGCRLPAHIDVLPDPQVTTEGAVALSRLVALRYLNLDSGG